jgi:hypothetical protein
MPRDQLVPYIQGQLDSFCGIYSIVNAVRFALRSVPFNRPHSTPRPWLLRPEEAELLFARLLVHLLRYRANARVVLDGLDAKQIEVLLTHVKKYLKTERALSLDVSRPFYRRQRVGLTGMLSCIDRHLCEPGTATIVGGNRPWDHWTVATRVSRSRLHLLDSGGDTSVAIRRGKRRLIYHAGLINPACVYLLAVSELGKNGRRSQI